MDTVALFVDINRFCQNLPDAVGQRPVLQSPRRTRRRPWPQLWVWQFFRAAPHCGRNRMFWLGVSIKYSTSGDSRPLRKKCNGGMLPGKIAAPDGRK